MALTKDQRIQISKKIIEIPESNKALDGVKDAIGAEKKAVEDEDQSNKSFMDEITIPINAYQTELGLLDGNGRVELAEQDLIDAADKTLQNFFFPNDTNTPLPSVPDGVWKFFAPFSGSVAIGKTYTESYNTITREQDKIDAINSVITTIEGLIDPVRSTGLQCQIDNSGTCSDPTYTDQATCELNGETWTSSGGPDTYVSSPTAQTALTDLVTAINDWKAFVNNERSNIYTSDPDTSRQSENDTAIQDIDDLIIEIDNYLTYDDFDTTTTLPSGSGGSGCSAYSALTSSDFLPSKLRSNELQEVKDSIAARESFISSRISQLEGYLGTVGQNLSTGDLTTSGSGFYNDRFTVINIRLNLLGGTLNRLKSIEQGQGAQDNLKATNTNTLGLYQSKIKSTKFIAPASNTGTIHVADASEFTIGDTVYVVADKQEELTGTITNINQNTVFLDFTIPEKYTHINFARLYRVV